MRGFGEAIADRYWELDDEYRLTYASEHGVGVGIPAEQLLGMHYWEVGAEHLSDEDIDKIRTALQARKSFRNLTYSRNLPDGRQIFVSISAMALFADNGEFAGYAGVLNDRSEAVFRERRAENVRNQLVYALEQLKTGIILWNADQRLVYCNEFFRELQNQTAEQLRPGRHISEILREMSYAPHLQITDDVREAWIEERLPDPDVKSESMEFHRNDGRWVLIRRETLDDGSMLVIHNEITDQKALAQAKSEFVALASHELRTPLTAISGTISLLKNGAVSDPDQVQDMLDNADRNCTRLTRLVNDILDLSRIETGKLEMDMQPVDATDLAEDAVALNSAFAQEYGSTIVIAKPAETLKVRGDSYRLQQVLTNLISNAVKFSPDGTNIEVSVALERNLVKFGVRDRGPGIPEELRDHIFEPFAQADATDTRNQSGTGLGLSISKAIIQHHGGAIEIVDNPGGGSFFYFVLERL